MKYEYLVLEVQNRTFLQAALNEKGALGWEALDLDRTAHDFIFVTFKRPLDPAHPLFVGV